MWAAMRVFTFPVLIVSLLLLTAACHPGPVFNTGTQSVGGTISGTVRATGGTVPLGGRKVTAVNVATGARYDTTTSTPGGGYTIKVPEGTYRLEVELRDGEALARRPGETHINNGDLDPGRDFDVTVKPAGSQ